MLIKWCIQYMNGYNSHGVDCVMVDPPGAGHSHQSDGQQAGGSADLQWFDPQAWQCTPGNSKTTKRKLILLLILTSP